VARKRAPAVRMQRPPSQTVQLKLRLPEWMRRDLERTAKDAARSMNSEILVRLRMSFVRTDFYEGKMTKLLAQKLVESLDSGIVLEMADIINRQHAEDEETDLQREEEQFRQDKTENEEEDSK
jgi:hypothetical protein